MYFIFLFKVPFSSNMPFELALSRQRIQTLQAEILSLRNTLKHQEGTLRDRAIKYDEAQKEIVKLRRVLRSSENQNHQEILKLHQVLQTTEETCRLREEALRDWSLKYVRLPPSSRVVVEKGITQFLKEFGSATNLLTFLGELYGQFGSLRDCHLRALQSGGYSGCDDALVRHFGDNEDRLALLRVELGQLWADYDACHERLRALETGEAGAFSAKLEKDNRALTKRNFELQRERALVQQNMCYMELKKGSTSMTVRRNMKDLIESFVTQAESRGWKAECHTKHKAYLCALKWRTLLADDPYALPTIGTHFEGTEEDFLFEYYGPRPLSISPSTLR